MKKIGIVIVATNAYFLLGVRLIKRWMHFYKGNCEIKFFFFSEIHPKYYIPEGINVFHQYTKHRCWRDGTNSKFSGILSLPKEELEGVTHLFYWDADSNITREFTEDWFIGEMVGGEHYANRSSMKDRKNFDRNLKSKAYIPLNTRLPQMYYYGAFFGGTTEKMMEFCSTLRKWQLQDKRINYEPCANDESYINKYFHVHPPAKVVHNEYFPFQVSNKGGIKETRDVRLDIEKQRKMLLEYRNEFIDVTGGEVILC